MFLSLPCSSETPAEQTQRSFKTAFFLWFNIKNSLVSLFWERYRNHLVHWSCSWDSADSTWSHLPLVSRPVPQGSPGPFNPRRIDSGTRVQPCHLCVVQLQKHKHYHCFNIHQIYIYISVQSPSQRHLQLRWGWLQELHSTAVSSNQTDSWLAVEQTNRSDRTTIRVK